MNPDAKEIPKHKNKNNACCILKGKLILVFDSKSLVNFIKSFIVQSIPFF